MKRLSNLLFVTLCLTAQPAGETFPTPELARDALVRACYTPGALQRLLGPGSERILTTGDAVRDKEILGRFTAEAAKRAIVVRDEMNRNRAMVMVGQNDWLFPIPLIDKNGRWYFDLAQGEQEIRYRVIGASELDAIEVCRGFVAAEFEYAETVHDEGGIPQYARRIVSSPGKKDGLYWPGGDSPVASAFAKAAAEGYDLAGKREPFHGYNYRVLTGQGPSATGGKRDYIIQGLMIGGFGLIAWPAQYGVSGLRTFIVNQEGIVYEKDLGPDTATAVKAITRFNPDKSWVISVPIPAAE